MPNSVKNREIIFFIKKRTVVSHSPHPPHPLSGVGSVCVQDAQLWGPFQAVIDEQCIELNRWHRGTPQSIILSHGFTFHHLVNPHTHRYTHKRTHAHRAHIISAAVKRRHLRP